MEISVKELCQELGKAAPIACGSSHSLRIGEKYIIRTVTYHYVGRLESITDTDLVLSDAAWVADSGRWNNALTTGELAEVEPYPQSVIVQRGAIVDLSVWAHHLPRLVR